MRKVLIILTVLLGVTCASAQAVWISPDGYCQYAVVDFGTHEGDELKLTAKHRSALEYIDYMVDQFKDKIQSQEYQIWVESYVGDQEADFVINRALARKMSNVVKSHIIANDGLVEDNFKTRNYCGTFDGYSGVTIVVVGMRYPIEQIVGKQRLFHDQVNHDLVRTSHKLPKFFDTKKVISSLGVDTSSIFNPNFRVMSFGGKSSNDDQSQGRAQDQTGGSFADHGVLGDDSFDGSGMSLFVKTPKNNEEGGGGGITESKQQPRSPIAVATGVAALTFTPGAVTTIVRIAPSPSSITPTNYRPQFVSNSEKAKHRREINKKIDDQLRQQKELQKQEELQAKLLAKQEKQRSKKEKQQIDSQIQSPDSTAVVGSVVSPSDKVLSIDELMAKGADNESMGRADNSAQSPSMSQDPIPQPFAPLSGYEEDKNAAIAPLPTAKRRAKGGLPLDGKSLEASINMSFIAEQKNIERVERVKQEKAVREIVHKKKVERFKAVQKSKGRFAVAGLGVNLLSPIALIPSLQLDAYFSDRLSIAAEGYYSIWNFNNKNVFNLSMASLELRYFCTGKKKAFDGFYVGIYGGVGEYDFRWGTQDGRQSQFLSVGLSVGYVLPLGKSNFYFEAGLSGGYVGERIEKYMRYDEGYVRLNQNFNNSTIFAPTKIKLSIIYRIFNQKK